MRIRTFIATAVVLTAGCGAPAITMADGASAARSLRLSTNLPTTPAVGEGFVVKGAMPTSGVRTVKLQKLEGKTWRNKKKFKTRSSGYYTSPAVSATGKSSFRVYASAAKVSGRNRGAAKSSTLSFTPAKPTGSIRRLPSVASDSTKSTVAQGLRASKDAVIARFSPARPSKDVTFEKYSGGKWKYYRKAKQNSRGEAGFTIASTDKTPLRARPASKAWKVSQLSSASPYLAASSSGGLAEEFTGLTGNRLPTGWINRYPNLEAPGRVCSRGSAGAISSNNDGILNVENKLFKGKFAPRDTCKGGKRVKLGHITTNIGDASKYEFNRGIAAARIKFPKERGMHGAFWLQSNDPKGAEIDIVEFFGDRPDGGLQNALHFKDGKGKTVTRSQMAPKATSLFPKGQTFYNSYHVYSVEWTSTQYIYRVDGIETFRTAKPSTVSPAVKSFPILSITTADYEIASRSSTPTNTMKVDWVSISPAK